MNILEKIVDHKKNEIKNLVINSSTKSFDERDFFKALFGKESLSLIAEIKRKSPSNSKIFHGEFDIAKIAKTFEDSGVSAISVLTDEKFFGGSFEYLSKAKKATKNVPILAKDFFISEKQIDVAKSFGADAILLIAKILDLDKLKELLEYMHSKKLYALVEIADEKDLKKVLETNAKIIGINNRNLENFKIDLAHTYSLTKKIPKDKVVISMSGFSGADIQLAKGISDSVLVGTAISGAKNIPDKITEFVKPKTLLKVCGVREIETAEFCEKNGVDLVGLNFVPSSKRNIFGIGQSIGSDDLSRCSNLSMTKKNVSSNRIDRSINSDDLVRYSNLSEIKIGQLQKVKEIRKKLSKTKVVGVFQNQEIEFVNKIADELRLDFVQLHGDENIEYCAKITRPIIKAITISSEQDFEEIKDYEKFVDIFLFDNKIGGSGEVFDHNILAKKLSLVKKPFFIAGGVNTENAKEIINKLKPTGIDTASGVEKDGMINEEKIFELVSIL